MKFNCCPKCGKKLEKKEIGDEGLVPFYVGLKCVREAWQFNY